MVYMAAKEYGVNTLMVIQMNDWKTIASGAIYLFQSGTIIYLILGVLFAYQHSRVKNKEEKTKNR